jgi:hypothetical protein
LSRAVDSMVAKTVYLDTFAFVKIAADESRAAAARRYFEEGGWELVVGTLNLLEIYSWPSCWSSVATFIASVPFCIAQNSDRVADAEVASYPGEIMLPTGFRSSDYAFSHADLREALEENLRVKIASFNEGFKGAYEDTLRTIVEDRDSFPPESGRKHSPEQRWFFLQKAVLSMLFPRHAAFLKKLVASQEVIKIDLFRSVYIQALAIYLEYHVQRKIGKPSDVGDICQLALVPYVDLAVLDNERNDLVQRMNRENQFQQRLPSCRLSEFLETIGVA